MKTKFTLFSLAASLAALTSLQAQTAVTKPVGYHTEDIDPGFNLIGVNVGNAVSAAGDFDADSANDADVDFTALLTEGTPYTVQNTTTGVLAKIDSWTANDLITTPELLVAIGDGYEIRQDQTIADIFGIDNEVGFLTGTQSVADVIWISDGGGLYTQVYFSTGQDGGFPAINDGWRFVGGLGGNPDADAAEVIAPFFFSMFIQRRGPDAMSLVFVGHVRGDSDAQGGGATSSVIDVTNGFNAVNRIVPVGVTLAEVNMADQLAAGTQDTGDVIWLPRAGGLYTQVYNSVGQGGGFPAIQDGLRYVGGLGGNPNADASAESLPSGMLIQRRSGDGSISVEVPPSLDI